MADLYSWLDGQYRIPVVEEPDAEESDFPDLGDDRFE
jgi:endogenous inhibitor of DNA gyrase (YacG/DUF329 family)